MEACNAYAYRSRMCLLCGRGALVVGGAAVQVEVAEESESSMKTAMLAGNARVQTLEAKVRQLEAELISAHSAECTAAQHKEDAGIGDTPREHVRAPTPRIVCKPEAFWLKQPLTAQTPPAAPPPEAHAPVVAPQPAGAGV